MSIYTRYTVPQTLAASTTVAPLHHLFIAALCAAVILATDGALADGFRGAFRVGAPEDAAAAERCMAGPAADTPQPATSTATATLVTKPAAIIIAHPCAIGPGQLAGEFRPRQLSISESQVAYVRRDA